MFVGTEQTKNSSNFENLYQLQELSTVKVQMIEELNAMKASDDFDGFKENIGSSADYNLKDAFWLAKIIGDEGKGYDNIDIDETIQKYVLRIISYTNYDFMIY